MLKIKRFLKELSCLDILSIFLILIAIVILLTDPNFKDTVVSWFFIFLIFINQIFMINQCQKSRRMLNK